MILWKNFLLMSKKRATLLALLAVSVLTAYLLVVSRIQSDVKVVTKTTTFRPHSPSVCLKNETTIAKSEVPTIDGTSNATITRDAVMDIWTNRCSHYLSLTGRVLYTPDVNITRRLMSRLKDYDGA